MGKKEKACDPDEPNDADCGDNWDHTAIDSENRLLLVIEPGRRTAETCEKVVREVQARTGGRTDLLLTSDEHAPYETAIRKVYGQGSADMPQSGAPGAQPGLPPNDLCYATVRKTREKGRVVNVVRTVVIGTLLLIRLYLTRSSVSRTINTSFVERHNGTDRHQNARKRRKTYCFSKDRRNHEATTYFVAYSYNFCWPVRTLRRPAPDGGWESVTPAMSAGLTDHVWSLRDWLTLPSRR